MPVKIVALSLPEDLLETLDSERGDVSRSRYFTKILRQRKDAGTIANQKPSVEQSMEVPA